MPVSKLHTLIAASALITSGLTNMAFADEVRCAEKYNLYAEAQTNWQNNSAARAVELLPEHAERINEYRDVQLTMIKRRKLAVHLALENYPDQVESWGSINRWIELSPELETKLSDLSPEFQKLTEKYQQLISKPASTSDDEFSATFRKTAISDPEFMQLMDDFNLKSREINSLSCKK
jgi:hypothetical protein